MSHTPHHDPHRDRNNTQVAPAATVEECRHAWADIDNWAFNHVHPPTRKGAKELRAAQIATDQAGLPRGYVSPMFGKFLSIQARLVKAEHILEVGTLGGYSAMWMASEVPGVHITTIEYSPKHAEVARRNIENAGLSNRIAVMEGAGLDILPELLGQVQSGQREKFGMTFIDADKMNSYAYAQYAAKMSYSGDCIIIDNW
jgi:predicted O-methyltransferase YrrM